MLAVKFKSPLLAARFIVAARFLRASYGSIAASPLACQLLAAGCRHHRHAGSGPLRARAAPALTGERSSLFTFLQQVRPDLAGPTPAKMSLRPNQLHGLRLS